MYCAYALAFWYGIRLLLKGEVTSSGTIVTVLFSVLIGTSAITMIAPSIGDFAKAAGAATKIFAVLDRKLNIDPLSSKGETPDPGPGTLVMTDVSFAYPARPSVKVLDSVSLNFEAGKVSAIVGASGSGKSTIVALLERWYDPVDGQIVFDGHEIKTLNVRWLRSQIGYVQQEPVLFNDTVYSNVVHGLFGTSMDDLPENEKRKLVQAACVEANADSFIQELPQGYDTNVGERGGLVSGGQKQRIAIARSIVANPRILLLDEATSALDPKAEEIVQAALDRVAKSRTTIMIAHKLSTVQKADKIIVMTQGKVIEQGTHSSLIAGNGPYASLVHAQNLHAADEDVSPEETEAIGGTPRNEKRLEHVLTPIKSIGSTDEPEDVSRKFSLARCLWIILYEHRRLWPYFLCGTLASVGGGAVFPLQAFIFSRIVTVFQLPEDQLQSNGNFWALIFFILALGVLISYASIGLFFTIAAFLASKVYRSEYFGAMLRQDAGFFDVEDHSAGAMTSKLSTDPQKLQDLISSNMGLILIVIVNLISSCALAIAVGWKLALVAIFGCIPPLFFAGFMRMRLEMSAQDRSAKPYRESARFVSEAVSAIRTVSSLTLEAKVLARYADRLDTSVKKSYKHTLVTMILFGLSDSLDLAAVALAFWWGARLLSQGEYSTQAFFIVFTAVIFGGQAAGFLFGFTLNTTKAHSAANQIIHLRNSQPPINSSTGITPDLSSIGGEFIRFKNVRFSYPSRPSIPVLRGLNLSINRGQSVGVVGASGCGKTTLIALLERFYDINSGSLEVAGHELRDLDVHAYRSRVGMVSQETTIYQGSIRENVLLGLSEADEKVDQERVVNACKAANIHEFILSLPEGYDTDAGSHGLALSGGQRQRLAIARALIRDPEILLFDEATSALDTQSERVVQEALIQAGQGRTVVSVAHRLSTIRHCDCIFVVEQGKVVERGSHEDLIRSRGIYAEMVKGQSLDREVKT
jgi:ATP-binding cassette, subfamily B (MDR/TAP), member 1